MQAMTEKKRSAESGFTFNGNLIETGFWLFLIVICNSALLRGEVAGDLIFVPQLVANGEWHRLLFSPFVHVSWYHLVLDATAFLLLWNGLLEERWRGRLLYFTCCWLGSLAVPLMFSTDIYLIGLCGLSGIAHGLFAVTALEMIFVREDKMSQRLGLVLLVGVIVKIGLELISNGTLMTSMHFGNIGDPIYTSHLGGLVGGTFAFGFRHYRSVKNMRSFWKSS